MTKPGHVDELTIDDETVDTDGMGILEDDLSGDLFELDDEDSGHSGGDDLDPADKQDEEEYTYLGQKIKSKDLSKDDRIAYVQKGMNYDKVHGRLTEFEKQIQEFSRTTGMDLKRAMEYIEEQSVAQKAAEYVETNGGSIDDAKEYFRNLRGAEKAKAEALQFKALSTISEQKTALKDKPFFSILEPEIDALVSQSINNGQPINVETAYQYLRGVKLEDLMEQEKSKSKAEVDQASKRAIADMQDKLKRGVPTVPETGKAKTTVRVNTAMASVFGNDPKDIAEYKAKQLKRS